MLNTAFSICAVVVVVQYVTAWQQSLDFDDCYNIYEVNKDKSYKLTWDGKTYFSGCKVTFHGYDPSEALDEYEVCVKATTWSVMDGGVKLYYYTGVLGTYLEKSFSKYSSSPTYEWCSDENEYVSVELILTGTTFYQGAITLQVTAVKTYKYYRNASKIGGIIGTVVVIAIIVGVIIAIVRRRRYIRTTTFAVPAAGGTTVITQYGTQQQSGYMTGQAGPPPYQPSTNISYPSAPPPAYQQ